MLDLSDHQLATLSAWAEIAILVWMVGERFLPSRKEGNVTAVTAPLVGIRRIWPAIWQNRTIVVAVVGLVIVAWLHFRSEPSELPDRTGYEPISSTNANLEFWKLEKSFDKESAEVFANGHIVNSGKATATNVRYSGVVFMKSVTYLPDKQISAVFKSLRIQIADPDVGETEINPGSTGVWFTLYGPQISNDEVKKMDEGTFYPIVINVLRYRDKTVREGKYIYTQTCAVIQKNVIGFCEGNYNKTFIAD